MKRMPNMNDNIDKYSALKEEKSSVVLIGIAVICVIIMLIMSIQVIAKLTDVRSQSLLKTEENSCETRIL